MLAQSQPKRWGCLGRTDQAATRLMVAAGQCPDKGIDNARVVLVAQSQVDPFDRRITLQQVGVVTRQVVISVADLDDSARQRQNLAKLAHLAKWRCLCLRASARTRASTTRGSY